MTHDLHSAAGIEQAIRALGHEFNHGVLEATKAIYAPSVGRQAREAGGVRSNIAYGTRERQVLDIYGRDEGPAILFIHGGGFIGGNKCGDDLFYANIGHAFAGVGIQGVLANYRLAPGATWPSGIEDIRAAVDWLRENLGLGEGGRPLVLVGQSAGATHVAGYLFGESTAAHANRHLKGAVLSSGVYRLGQFRSAGAIAYFGEDAAIDATRSPMSQVKATPVPVMVTVSELDPANIAWHSFEMAQLLTQANGKTPVFHWFQGHNHVSTVHSLGSPQAGVMQALQAFVQRCAAG